MRKNPKKLSCEEALKKLFDYIDRELDSAETEILEMHLSNCRHCLDRVEFERLLKNRLRNLKREESSKELRDRIEEIIDRI